MQYLTDRRRSAVVGLLTRSDAVLRILDVLDSSGSPSAPRLLLEGMAYMAQQPGYDTQPCRVLRAFDGDDWRLGLHGSLAYLLQMDRASHVSGRWSLSDLGRQRLAEIETPAGLDQRQEAEDILRLARFVREGLGV